MKKWLFLFCFLVSTDVLRCSNQKHDMKKRSVYFCILAGGSGERLWPLSEGQLPKQLLSLGTGSSFLQQAIERIQNLVDSSKNVWVVTSKKYETVIRDHIGASVGTILAEPSARNTGPAILYCCLAVQKIDPGAVLVFLPADPFIPASDTKKFSELLSHAIDFASNSENIALLGIKPTHAATGYGYIEFDTEQRDMLTGVHKVVRFYEKPCLESAEKFIHNNSMLWNIGMFCGIVSVFIDSFKKLAPDIYEAMLDYLSGHGLYNDIPSVSIDYALIEKCSNTYVLPADFTWYDVGNIDVFLRLKNQYSYLRNNTVEVDAHDNLIDVPDRLVALVGVDNLCVVQTNNALLITKRDQAEKVKLVVGKVNEQKKTKFL